jgi:hypothetical protein
VNPSSGCQAHSPAPTRHELSVAKDAQSSMVQFVVLVLTDEDVAVAVQRRLAGAVLARMEDEVRTTRMEDLLNIIMSNY